MSLGTYFDYELKIFKVVKIEEKWEGDGTVTREVFELRDGDEVLRETESLDDWFKY